MPDESFSSGLKNQMKDAKIAGFITGKIERLKTGHNSLVAYSLFLAPEYRGPEYRDKEGSSVIAVMLIRHFCVEGVWRKCHDVRIRDMLPQSAKEIRAALTTIINEKFELITQSGQIGPNLYRTGVILLPQTLLKRIRLIGRELLMPRLRYATKQQHPKH